ncbi:MAG: hypothetical protein V1899_08230 [Planctomycetota bacterium]
MIQIGESRAISRPRKWLRYLFIVFAILMSILALTGIGLRLYFNSAWFKARLETALKETLERNAEIATVDVSFWRGSIVLWGLRAPNARTGFNDPDTLRCDNIHVEMALWPALFSDFTKIENLKIELWHPQLIIERQGAYPNSITNVDDLIRKFIAGPPCVWPKTTGLRSLNVELVIHDGIVSFTDSTLKPETSRLEKIEFSAHLDGLGQPLKMKFQAALVTPNSNTPGRIDSAAQIVLIDSDGNIDSNAFKDFHAQLALNNVDLPYLAHCAGARNDLANGRYQWTPGKPITGVITLVAPARSAINFTADIDLESAQNMLAPSGSDEYQLTGRVTSIGSFECQNFTLFESSTWNGDLKAAVTNLVAIKRADKNSEIDWIKLGARIFGEFGNRVARLYSDDFGLFLNKLEFEPLGISLKINRGQITLTRTNVLGKANTRSAGLCLEVEGGIYLPQKEFVPQLIIRIIKLPPYVQKQLRFDKLAKAERQTILTRFEQRQFEPPIILTGKTSDPLSNWIQVALAFSNLDLEIDRLLQPKPAPATSPRAADGKN